MKSLVKDIRNLEKSLGSFRKDVRSSEREDKRLATRSIHAARDIVKGEKIDRRMIAIKRPSLGISPWQMNNVVGKKAKTDIRADQWITKDLIK